MADFISMLAGAAGGGAEETDPDFKQTVLLLHGDGTNGAQNNTFVDSSTNNFTITRNGNTTQGTFSPFSVAEGQWSNYFDGTDDYLSVADNAVLRPGAGAFTLEAWVYRNAAGAAHTIYAKGGASTGINFQITSGNVLRFTHTTTNIDSTGTVAANAWVHVAVVREGTGANQTKLYINGTQDGQGTVSTDFTQTEEVRIGTNRSAGDDFAGYISNVRFVKGSALYTGNFTPSTSPFTTTSQGASSSEVELLTCQSNRFVDNSSNAFAITVNGNTSVQPFSPFAPTAAYSTSVNGGSGYFDGSGDYLDLAPGTIGTGDFTLECWVYFNSLSANQGILDTRDNSNTNGFALVGRSTGQVSMADGTSLIGTAASATAGQWIHVAASRASGVLSFYVNGTRSGGTLSNTSNFSNNRLRVGAIGSAGENLGGYVASARLLTTAIYSGTTITVPTAPLTAISGTSALLNFTNAGIFDNTGKNNLETVGNAQIDTTTKKYGTGSMEFDGTGDYLAMGGGQADNFAFGTGDFTVEFWLYLNTTSGTPIIYDSRPPSTNGAQPTIYMNGAVITYFANAANRITGSSLSTSTWYHIALARSGTSTKLFVDGSQVGSTYTDSTNYTNATNRPFIGVDSASGNTNYFNGFIDDLRITKGVARYTANFTPPDKAFLDQ